MAFTKLPPKKHDTPEWLRFQYAVRKMMAHLGKDALIYAQSALTHEDDDPDRLRTFWENARKFFDDYEQPAKPILKAQKTDPEAVPEAKAEGT